MATLPNRTFEAADAQREHVPLLIGLTGPSGGGKTFSALRLATGIQEVTGGDIYFIDTESRRALHYADKFKFKHVEFGAPFGSLDYLAALQWCVEQGAKVIIVDSMSHEHEGPGGMVDLHDQILDRMAGNDFKKRERVQMLAWAEPKQKRRALINGILQLNANFIFCFRAKNSAKPGKDKDGRSAVIQQGFVPIAGEEFVYEQTLNALLLPGAGGVPTWSSDEIGEKRMIKLPEQFLALRDRNKPLDESVGKRLAMWAAGSPAIVKTADDARTFKANDTEPSPAAIAPDEAGPAPQAGEAAAPANGLQERMSNVAKGGIASHEPEGFEPEGRDDSQRGEHDPFREAADRLIADAREGVRRTAKAQADYDALPDELRAEVDAARGGLV